MKKHACRSLLCLLLALSVTMTCALAAVPSQVSVSHNDFPDQQDAFSFDSQGRLSQVQIVFAGLDKNILHTYTYDADGRILKADRGDFWEYFTNDAYIYDHLGLPSRYICYWGDETIPYWQEDYVYDSNGRRLTETLLLRDADGKNQELSAIYIYSYVLDNAGRVAESHRHTQFIVNASTMVNAYGEYPMADNVLVSQYTYDDQDRVSSVRTVNLPKSAYQSDGHEFSADDGDILYYYYDYAPFLITAYENGVATIALTDSQGTEIWSMNIPDQIYVDGDRLVSAEDKSSGTVVEFTYTE